MGEGGTKGSRDCISNLQNVIIFIIKKMSFNNSPLNSLIPLNKVDCFAGLMRSRQAGADGGGQRESGGQQAHRLPC